MKIIILSLCFFSALQATAQNKQYFDHNWKPSEPNYARFVSLTDKTDSGWVRRDFYLSTKKSQMKGLYKDSTLKIKNGWFRYFYVNQVLSSQGNYVNNEKDGLWLSYYFNGMMKDSIFYEAGYPESRMAWHSNGYVSDSSVYHKDGNAEHRYWFDNGQLSHYGNSFGGKKEGDWRYFHKNGKRAAVETYSRDESMSRIYYDETGTQLASDVSKDRAAGFKGGTKKWRSYLHNNMDFLDGVKLVNTFFVTVVVAVTIDEEGNITDAYAEVPVSPAFDKQAIKVLEKSPQWLPAIDHNRFVKSYYRQAITFGQID